MNASFIPASERIPGVYQEVQLQRQAGARGTARKVCLIAYRVATASSQDDLSPVRVRNRGEAALIGGAGSMIDLMAKGAFEAGRLAQDDATPGATPEIYVLSVPEPSGVGTAAATSTLTLTGSATANGTLPVYVHGLVVVVAVIAGDTPTALAARVKAALDLRAPDLFYTPSVAAGVLTLTCKHKGELGNQLVLWADTRNAPGITATAAAGTAGAGTVDLTAALAASLEIDFDAVVVPQADTATRALIKPHVAAAWRFDRERYRVVVFSNPGDVSDAQTDSTTITDWRVSQPHAEKVTGTGEPFDHKASAPVLSFVLAAQYAARIFTQRAPNWNFNGASLPGGARPANIDRDALNDTLAAGVAEVIEDVTRPGLATIVDAITTATTDQTGQTNPPAPDLTWLPIEVPKTVAYVLRQMKLELDRFKQAVADEQTRISIKSAALQVLSFAERDGYITGAPRPDGTARPIGDEAVIVEYAVLDGKTTAVITLDYAVIVGLDQVAVTHNVRRAL